MILSVFFQNHKAFFHRVFCLLFETKTSILMIFLLFIELNSNFLPPKIS